MSQIGISTVMSLKMRKLERLVLTQPKQVSSQFSYSTTPPPIPPTTKTFIKAKKNFTSNLTKLELLLDLKEAIVSKGIAESEEQLIVEITEIKAKLEKLRKVER